MKRSIFLWAALLLTQLTFSQTTSWTGAADSTWHNSANWTSGIPTDAVDVVIGDANYSGSFHPAVLAGARCRTLTLNSGFKLSVYTNDTIIINGNLTNNGLIHGDSASFAFNANNVTLCGTGIGIYKSLTVLPGVNFIINKNISLTGNLVVDGSLSAIGKTISFVGKTPSLITGSGSITLGNIVQDKTNSYTRFESPVTVNGNLDLTSGVIYTSSSGMLTLADNATASNGNNSSYVDGPMEKMGNDAFVFPLGNNGVWARLGISAPSVVMDGFVAQYYASAYSNTDSIIPSSPAMQNVSKLEYWTCERSAGSSDVSVTLYWDDNVRSDLGDFTSVVVAHWNGTGWENAGNSGIIPLAQGNITSFIQSAFSPFTFGSLSNANPMPIGLLNFSANLDVNKEARLAWQTATETNNRHFTVEKSMDGINYSAVATFEGAGTSLLKHSYEYADATPYIGYTYYRLKQTDYNGKFSYSPVRMVQVSNERASIEVYPNPLKGENFSVGLPGGTQISRIVLLDAMGQQVFATDVWGSEISKVEVVAPAALAAGVYTLVAIGDSQSYKKRLVIE